MLPRGTENEWGERRLGTEAADEGNEIIQSLLVTGFDVWGEQLEWMQKEMRNHPKDLRKGLAWSGSPHSRR